MLFGGRDVSIYDGHYHYRLIVVLSSSCCQSYVTRSFVRFIPLIIYYDFCEVFGGVWRCLEVFGGVVVRCCCEVLL